MNYNLLQQALDALEYARDDGSDVGDALITDIRTELQNQIKQELNKPDLTEVGVFEITKGSYGPLNLTNGKYKLLAQKINE